DGAEAQSSTFRMDVSENYTYKDADTLLRQLPSDGASARQLQVPAGTDTGLLFAVREMVHEMAATYKSSGELAVPQPRQYVYNAHLYSLSMDDSRLKERLKI